MEGLKVTIKEMEDSKKATEKEHQKVLEQCKVCKYVVSNKICMYIRTHSYVIVAPRSIIQLHVTELTMTSQENYMNRDLSLRNAYFIFHCLINETFKSLIFDAKLKHSLLLMCHTCSPTHLE